VRTNPSGASQTKAANPQNAPVSRPAKLSFQLER
jgi:hypothetical protein